MWGLTSPRSSGRESDLLVLSFRSHHNAYVEGDGSGATIERYPCPTSLSFQVIQFIFSFVIVHYLLYWLPMLATVAGIARYVSHSAMPRKHQQSTALCARTRTGGRRRAVQYSAVEWSAVRTQPSGQTISARLALLLHSSAFYRHHCSLLCNACCLRRAAAGRSTCCAVRVADRSACLSCVLCAVCACQGYWWLSVLLVAWYSRSYFDRAQFKTGRAWNWSAEGRESRRGALSDRQTDRQTDKEAGRHSSLDLPCLLCSAPALLRSAPLCIVLCCVVCAVRFRQNRLWYLAHQYCELELVRTAKLDPARKYIFAVHPHGILIISRIGLYGGRTTHAHTHTAHSRQTY